VKVKLLAEIKRLYLEEVLMKTKKLLALSLLSIVNTAQGSGSMEMTEAQITEVEFKFPRGAPGSIKVVVFLPGQEEPKAIVETTDKVHKLFPPINPHAVNFVNFAKAPNENAIDMNTLLPTDRSTTNESVGYYEISAFIPNDPLPLESYRRLLLSSTNEFKDGKKYRMILRSDSNNTPIVKTRFEDLEQMDIS
jgi:hypothetical protein